MNSQARFPAFITTMATAISLMFPAQSGLQVKNPATGVPAAKTLGVAPVDLDGDGWMDLVVANDTVQNLVFPQPTRRHVQRDRGSIGHCVRQLWKQPRSDGHRRRPLSQ